jgi:hypothetical protein
LALKKSREIDAGMQRKCDPVDLEHMKSWEYVKDLHENIAWLEETLRDFRAKLEQLEKEGLEGTEPTEPTESTQCSIFSVSLFQRAIGVYNAQ